VIFFSAAVKLFVHSADPTEIGACVAAKATAGVTTSAAQLEDAARRGGGTPRDLLAEICGVANGPVCVAVAATDHDGILREARDWAAVADNVVVELLGTDVEIDLIRACVAARIPTGVLAGTSPEQALAAARTGAAYMTVPVGRAGGVDGYDLIRKLVALLRTCDAATQVIAGAIRIPTNIIDAALAGAHAASAPGDVVRDLDAESTRRADGRT
jgi:transaldolase